MTIKNENYLNTKILYPRVLYEKNKRTENFLGDRPKCY